MDRKEARKAAEVMLAYADGKEIEIGDSRKNLWHSVGHPSFDWVANDYRIKPTHTYRPFTNAEECWEEMKKHEPFGWVRNKEKDCYIQLHCVGEKYSFTTPNEGWTALGIMDNYTFADGSVFGKLTEEKE